MKVKVGDVVYDVEKVPVMVILSDADKRNITDMPPEATRYASFPLDSPLDPEKIQRWMDAI